MKVIVELQMDNGKGGSISFHAPPWQVHAETFEVSGWRTVSTNLRLTGAVI